MRTHHLFLFLGLVAGSVGAQTVSPPPPVSADAPAENAATGDRRNQRIEHLHTEDGGSRIDELRVGGQIQSISVQPKVGNMPAYEVVPRSGARSLPGGGSLSGNEDTNGPRVWNLKKF